MSVATVGELVAMLAEYDEAMPVRIAFQPEWPLRATVRNVTDSLEVLEAQAGRYDDEAELPRDDEPPVVWIAVDQVSGDEHPYAPREAWAG